MRPSNVKAIFQRPSCDDPYNGASGFIASSAPVDTVWYEMLFWYVLKSRHKLP